MKRTGMCTFWELDARLRCCLIIQHLSGPMGGVEGQLLYHYFYTKWDKCFIKSTGEFINVVSYWTWSCIHHQHNLVCGHFNSYCCTWISVFKSALWPLKPTIFTFNIKKCTQAWPWIKWRTLSIRVWCLWPKPPAQP